MKNMTSTQKGYTKYRVIAASTIMRREQIKQAKEEQRETNRIARLQERQDKKFAGMDSLF